jgi:hypothetical protein
VTAEQGEARIAVLLSTFNGEAFLRQQLDSVAAQAGVAVEVFARDDGSTDGTLEILSAYADRWPQLAAPVTGDKLGPAGSFLRLLAAAPGDFDHYAFCDQDDVWLPGKLARAAQALAGRPDGAALYCSRVTRADRLLRPIGPSPLDGDGRFAHLLFENIAFGNTVVMNAQSRSIVVAATPDSGVIMHDWWCALVTSAFGRILYDETPGVLYRQHGGNVVGAAPGRAAEILTHLRALARRPGGFYPIRAQAAAFLHLHGASAGGEARALAEALVASRRSLPARLRYALAGPIVRRRRLDALAARLLVALGLY